MKQADIDKKIEELEETINYLNKIVADLKALTSYKEPAPKKVTKAQIVRAETRAKFLMKHKK